MDGDDQQAPGCKPPASSSRTSAWRGMARRVTAWRGQARNAASSTHSGASPGRRPILDGHRTAGMGPAGLGWSRRGKESGRWSHARFDSGWSAHRKAPLGVDRHGWARRGKAWRGAAWQRHGRACRGPIPSGDGVRRSGDHFRMFRLAPGPDWRALRTPDRGLLRELLLACDEDWSFPMRGDATGAVASAVSAQPEDRRWLRAVVDRLLEAGALEAWGARIRVAGWVVDAAVSPPKSGKQPTHDEHSADSSPTHDERSADRPPTEPVQTSRGTTRNHLPEDPQKRREKKREEERERIRAHAPEAPPLPDPPDDVEPTALTPEPARVLRRAIAERYADAHRELTGAEWPVARFQVEREDLASLLEAEATKRSVDASKLLEHVLAAFVADDWVRERTPSFKYLVRELHRFLPKLGKRAAKRDHGPTDADRLEWASRGFDDGGVPVDASGLRPFERGHRAAPSRETPGARRTREASHDEADLAAEAARVAAQVAAMRRGNA